MKFDLKTPEQYIAMRVLSFAALFLWIALQARMEPGIVQAGALIIPVACLLGSILLVWGLQVARNSPRSVALPGPGSGRWHHNWNRVVCHLFDLTG